MVSGSILVARGGTRSVEQQAQIGERVEISADDDPVMGSSRAKVTIIEFSDYQCPFCRTFWRETLPQIKKDYIDTGKVKFVYRDYPLGFHPAAKPSAVAANCAGEQGKYYEMHDKIFAEQDKKGEGTVQFENSEIQSWVGQIGLDTSKFNQCFSSGKYDAEIDKDTADGSAAGVEGTPTFFINGQKIIGAQPYSIFKSTLDSLLK